VRRGRRRSATPRPARQDPYYSRRCRPTGSRRCCGRMRSGWGVRCSTSRCSMRSGAPSRRRCASASLSALWTPAGLLRARAQLHPSPVSALALRHVPGTRCRDARGGARLPRELLPAGQCEPDRIRNFDPAQLERWVDRHLAPIPRPARPIVRHRMPVQQASAAAGSPPTRLTCRSRPCC
jgi:hypothetical protein